MMGMGLGISVAAGSAPVFSPKSLANLTLWLRADLGVVGGGSPAAWNDQSGAGNNLPTSSPGGAGFSASGGPNSTPVVIFANNTVSLSGVGRPVNGNAFSIHVVHKFSATPAGPGFGLVLGNATPVKLGTDATPHRLFDIGANTQTGGTATTSFEAWSWVGTAGGAQTLLVNGSSVGLSGNIAAATPDANVTIVGIAAAGVVYSVAEIIVQNGNTTAGEQTSINAYFLSRYGL